MSSKLTKTSKTHGDFEGQESDHHQKLEFYDTGKNHNKFWHVWTYGRYVVRHWGRHGSKGQTVVHQAYSTWDAKEEAERLYWQKKDKGYVSDTTTALDHIVRGIGG